MSPLNPSRQTSARAFAVMVSLVLGTSFAQPAPATGAAAGSTGASVGAAPPAAPATVHISPHARAARQRAAAQAAEPAASGIRVSAFTTRRKPHNLAAAR